MAAESKITTDHDEIRSWVEQHNGSPASVRGTESSGADGVLAGVLRIDFPGGAGQDELEHIGWEEWFAKFEKEQLAFLYQRQHADGSDSTFVKLISRQED